MGRSRSEHVRRARGLVLLAMLAMLVGLAGCGRADSSPSADPSTADPAPPTATTSLEQIPDDFPLGAGMGDPVDDLQRGLTGLTVCGTAPLAALEPRDRMVADNSGGEAADTRDLFLLADGSDAAAVAESFARHARSCTSSPLPGQPGGEVLTEVRPSPLAGDPAVVLVQTYTFDGRPGTGVTVTHVVPAGQAVLVSSTYRDSDAAGADRLVDASVAALTDTVAALRALVGAEETGSTPSTTPTAATTIPDDFPLAAGLPHGDADVEVSAPSADGDGIGEVEMCGTVVWPAGGSGDAPARLATSAHGPELFMGRELLVHQDADSALAAMRPIRRAARSCRSVDNQVWTRLDRDTGWDTVTVGLTYDDGLGSSVFQLTRVGSALLLVATYGEGSLDSLGAQADDVTTTTGAIAPAMCAFTEEGC